MVTSKVFVEKWLTDNGMLIADLYTYEGEAFEPIDKGFVSARWGVFFSM